jgi:ATP-dependent RNA helicase RhlE
MTGEAFTFVSPQEEDELRSIERAVGKALPRVSLPDFNYTAKPSERFEVPVGERLAAHRARRQQERANQRANEERRAAHAARESAAAPDSPRPRRRRRRGPPRSG